MNNTTPPQDPNEKGVPPNRKFAIQRKDAPALTQNPQTEAAIPPNPTLAKPKGAPPGFAQRLGQPATTPMGQPGITPMQVRGLSKIPFPASPTADKSPASEPPAPISSAKAAPSAKNMSFEAYRQSKVAPKPVAKLRSDKIDRGRYHMVEGMQGQGEKYQDQRVGNALETNLTHENDDYSKSLKDQHVGNALENHLVHADEQDVKASHDHRLGDGFARGHSPRGAGTGGKYQDHRLGAGVNGELNFSAGQGAKYQDHRLGKGLKPSATEAE